MSTSLNPDSGNLLYKKMLEEFFDDYPAARAEELFWHWFLKCLNNDFGGVEDKELQELSEFFDRLHQLEQASQQHENEILTGKSRHE